MSKRREVDSFEQSLRRKFEGAEVLPAPEMWSRIEASLDRSTHLSPWVLAMRWGGAVAASITIALGLSVWFTPNSVEEPYEAFIAEFIQMEALPIEIEAVKLSQVVPKFTYEQEATTQNVEVPLAHEVNREKEEIESEVQSSKQEIENERYVPSSTTLQSNIPRSIEPTAILGNSNLWRYAKPTALVALLAGGATAVDYLAGTTSSDMSAPSIDHNVGSSDATIGYPFILTSNSALPTNNIDAKNATSNYNTEYSHKVSLSYAMSISKMIGKRWSLESGLTYSRLSSDVTANEATSSQVVQYIGVPLHLNYNIYASPKFSLYAGAGAQLERCISATLGSNRVDEYNWHSAAEGALGVQYNINSWMGLYAEPRVQYYFTPSKLTTIRTESPLCFDLRFGLRFRL
ncbi:MAG: outer membrane beta-barrel protein [Rikenellaceae bacterium]